MRILYFSGAKFPSKETHTLSIMRMCQAFHDTGNETLLFGRLNNGGSQSEVISKYGLKGGFRCFLFNISRFLDNRISRPFFVPGFALSLCSLRNLREFKPDLIYSRLTISELLFVPNHIPIILEMHSLGPIARGGLALLIFKYILRRKNVCRIITTTKILAELISKEFPNIELRVAKLSASLPIEFDNVVVEKFRRKNLKGKNFKHHVGYTGALDTIGLRGTDLICKIASVTPNVAFHIVGGEDETVDFWKHFSKDFNLHENIFFYGHWKSSDIPLFLFCFDIVMAPLQRKITKLAPTGMGMSPLKLAEYLSYGKVILASDIESHRNILTAEKDSVLLSPADFKGWSKSINELLQNPNKLKSISNAAKQKYYSEYTPDKRVKRILSDL